MKHLRFPLFLLPLLLAGCSASWYQARDIKKQHTLNYQYPNSLALDCAKWFPMKDSVGKSVFVPADNVNLLPVVDSLQNYINILLSAAQPVIVNGKVQPLDSLKFINAFNTLQVKYNALKAAYKPCKPDTFKTAPVFITNTALVTSWQTKYNTVHDSLTTSTANLKSVKHGKNTWMYIALGACLVIIGGAAISIYKFFNGGAILGTVKKII